MANILVENLKTLWNAWKRLAHKIGNFQARVVLTIIYAIAVLPFGLVVRLFSDPLRIKHRPANWIEHPAEVHDIDWARRQWPMHILGISCYYHDAAAAILRDGQLVAAAEEERFSRVKHDVGFPKHAIEFCLREAKIDAKDVDYVVFYERPFRKLDRLLISVLQTYPQSWKVFRESMIGWMLDKLWIASTLQSELGVSR